MFKRLLLAFALGFGVIFAPKGTDQHWSETTAVLVDEERAEGESSDE